MIKCVQYNFIIAILHISTINSTSNQWKKTIPTRNWPWSNMNEPCWTTWFTVLNWSSQSFFQPIPMLRLEIAFHDHPDRQWRDGETVNTTGAPPWHFSGGLGLVSELSSGYRWWHQRWAWRGNPRDALHNWLPLASIQTIVNHYHHDDSDISRHEHHYQPWFTIIDHRYVPSFCS